jgi:hypothetical protein
LNVEALQAGLSLEGRAEALRAEVKGYGGQCRVKWNLERVVVVVEEKKDAATWHWPELM